MLSTFLQMVPLKWPTSSKTPNLSQHLWRPTNILQRQDFRRKSFLFLFNTLEHVLTQNTSRCAKHIFPRTRFKGSLLSYMCNIQPTPKFPNQSLQKHTPPSPIRSQNARQNARAVWGAVKLSGRPETRYTGNRGQGLGRASVKISIGSASDHVHLLHQKSLRSWMSYGDNLETPYSPS